MKVYAVIYSRGWPEDGDDIAGIYSTEALAEAAKAKDARVWTVVEMEIDADPEFCEK